MKKKFIGFEEGEEKRLSESLPSNMKLVQGTRSKKKKGKKKKKEEERTVEDSLASLPKQIEMWIKGHLDAPPKGVEKVLKDLLDKTRFVLGYSTILELGKLSSLSQIKGKLEKELYENRKLKDYTTKELIEMNKQLHKEVKETLEFTRKFTSDSENFLPEEQLTDNIKRILLSMKFDTLKGLQETLREQVKG